MRRTACAILLLAACAPVQLGAPAGGAAPAPSGRAAVDEMAQMVNAHRRARRCAPLVWMRGLGNAAQAHSDDMARRRYFEHVSPEGTGPAERVRLYGVSYRALAENLAHHSGAPRQVLAGWLASPGHRRNLDDCTYTHHGIGVRDGRWTHLFVTPLAPASR